MARGLDAGKYFWRSGREKCFSLDIPFNRTSGKTVMGIAGSRHRWQSNFARLRKPWRRLVAPVTEYVAQELWSSVSKQTNLKNQACSPIDCHAPYAEQQAGGERGAAIATIDSSATAR